MYKPPEGVYFLYWERELVYVGQTNDIFRRISEHAHGRVKPGQKKKAFDSWSYVECDSEEMRISIENLIISLKHPKYNEDFKPWRCGTKRDWDFIINHKLNISAAELIEGLLNLNEQDKDHEDFTRQLAVVV